VYKHNQAVRSSLVADEDIPVVVPAAKPSDKMQDYLKK